MSVIITLIDSGRFGGILQSEYECYMEMHFPGYYFEYITDVRALLNFGDLGNCIIIGFGKVGFDILRTAYIHMAGKVVLFLPQTTYKNKVLSSLYDKCDLTEYTQFRTNYHIFMREPVKQRDFMNVHFYEFDGSLQRMKRNGKLLKLLQEILP